MICTVKSWVIGLGGFICSISNAIACASYAPIMMGSRRLPPASIKMRAYAEAVRVLVVSPKISISTMNSSAAPPPELSMKCAGLIGWSMILPVNHLGRLSGSKMRDSDINSNYAHGILRSAKEQKEELCRHAQLDDDGRHIIEQHKFDALMKELFEQLESFLDDNAVGIELTPEEKIYVLERVLTFKNISIEKFSDKAGVNSNSYRSLDEFIQHNFVTITLDNVFIEKFYTGHYPYGYFSYIVKNSKILDHLFHGYKNDCHFLADNCDIDTLELARIKSPLGNSTFQNKTKIRYIEANDLSIKGFRLHDCELGHSDGILNLNFDDATFMAPTLFKNCVFYSSPSFHNTKFYSDTVFKDCVVSSVNGFIPLRAKIIPPPTVFLTCVVKL